MKRFIFSYKVMEFESIDAGEMPVGNDYFNFFSSGVSRAYRPSTAW